MDDNSVYVLIVSSEWGEDIKVHSVYKTEKAAQNAQQKLESVLGDDTIVYWEQHELYE